MYRFLAFFNQWETLKVRLSFCFHKYAISIAFSTHLMKQLYAWSFCILYVRIYYNAVCFSPCFRSTCLELIIGSFL